MPPCARPSHACRLISSALAVGLTASLGSACRREAGEAGRPGVAARPSILLVTLDTTRADAIGPEASPLETPGFDALAARGRRFLQAYATTPETLPTN